MEMCGGYFQTIRTVAGLTQERAADGLPISLRTLQGYEAKDKVPDDVCGIMETVYGLPLVRSPVEAGFQVFMADSIIDQAVEMAKAVFADRKIADDEIEIAFELTQALDRAAGIIFSTSAFIKSQLAQKNAPFDVAASTARRGA